MAESSPVERQKSGAPWIYSLGALGGVVRGYELGVVAAALLFAVPALHMTPWVTGSVVSSALLGSIVGAFTAGPVSDIAGRRKVIAAAAIIFTCGITGAALSPNVAVLLCSRLALGAAVGIATVIIPVYIAEIAPAQQRGAFTGLFQVMIYVGVLASSIAGIGLAPYRAWRWMFALGALPALLMLGGAYFLPESPRWLARQGRDDEARAVLARFRQPERVERELEGIRDIIQQENKRIGLRTLLRSARLRRLLLVGSGLGILQQLVGINAITYYAPTILKHIGFTNSESILANFGFSALGLLMTGVMLLFVVDKVGRRKPLIFGALGMTLSMAELAIVFSRDGATAEAGYLAIACLALFQISFALSWGGVVWIMLGEMFPLRARGTAMGIAVFMTEMTSVAVGAVFPKLLATGPATAFIGFAVMGIAAFLWAVFLVPETKQRSLEDIESDLALDE